MSAWEHAENMGLTALRADCRAAYLAWSRSTLSSRDSLPWKWWQYLPDSYLADVDPLAF